MEIWFRTPGEVTGEISQGDALPATLVTTGRCRVALRRGSKCPSFTRKHTRCTIVASLAVACSMSGLTGQARLGAGERRSPICGWPASLA